MIMNVTLFSEDWYHKIIQQTMDSFDDDASSDARAIGQSIMVAGCCIGQSLDNLAKKLEEQEFA